MSNRFVLLSDIRKLKEEYGFPWTKHYAYRLYEKGRYPKLMFKFGSRLYVDTTYLAELLVEAQRKDAQKKGEIK